MVERQCVASLVHAYNKDEVQLLSLREILCTLILRSLGVGVMLSSCIHLHLPQLLWWRRATELCVVASYTCMENECPL